MREIALLSLLLTGCALQQDFEYESKKELIAVNCFLHPDSTISVSVSQTAPYPDGNSFKKVENASVKIYENGLPLSTILYNEEKQRYTLNYYPKEGFSYRLVVKVTGQDSLVATTRVPVNSISQACYSPFPRGEDRFNNKIFVDIHIKKPDPAAVNWIGITSNVFERKPIADFPYSAIDSSSVRRAFAGSLYSKSSVIDRFNGRLEDGLNAYMFYLRLNRSANLNEYQVDAFSFDTNHFFTYRQIQNLHDRLGLYVHVFTASEEYDKYWKSSLLYFLNKSSESDTPNPFAEQVVNYSNITNGTGIFAGYNSQTVEVHKHKCN